METILITTQIIKEDGSIYGIGSSTYYQINNSTTRKVYPTKMDTFDSC